MRNITRLILLCLVLSSCVRRELTYSYNPTVEVVINVDWKNMSTTPTGMSVYCYPISGEAPTVKETNSVTSTTVSLGVGEYKILVFNQRPSELSTVAFTGLSSYETAEVCAAATTSKWYSTKADEDLLYSPKEIAAATYLTVVVPQEAIDEVLGLREKYYGTDFVADTYITIYMTPEVIIKNTRVTVEIDGVHNLRSARATLTGMATGYNFAKAQSHSSHSTHLLESWSSTVYTHDVTQGEIYTYFTCFGMPNSTSATTAVDDTWIGSMHLEMLLVDDTTITEPDHSLSSENTTLVFVTSGDSSKSDEEQSYSSTDINISVDIAGEVKLDDVEPTGGTSGGFNASVDDWGDEENVQLPT